jgi:hypothetical protein
VRDHLSRWHSPASACNSPECSPLPQPGGQYLVGQAQRVLIPALVDQTETAWLLGSWLCVEQAKMKRVSVSQLLAHFETTLLPARWGWSNRLSRKTHPALPCESHTQQSA